MEKKWTYSLDESSSDFRSLGIQCNSHRSVGDRIRGEALCSFSHVLDCALMILARETDGNFNLPLCTPKTAQATIQHSRTAAWPGLGFHCQADGQTLLQLWPKSSRRIRDLLRGYYPCTYLHFISRAKAISDGSSGLQHRAPGFKTLSHAHVLLIPLVSDTFVRKLHLNYPWMSFR